LFFVFVVVVVLLLIVTFIVYPSSSFDPLAVLQAIQEERCTAVHGVPTMFIAELEHPQFDSFDLSSLRTGIMGRYPFFFISLPVSLVFSLCHPLAAGAPCPVEVMRKVMDDMHCKEITICESFLPFYKITYFPSLPLSTLIFV
jgi:fatty-acyl-CoA synthase